MKENQKIEPPKDFVEMGIPWHRVGCVDVDGVIIEFGNPHRKIGHPIEGAFEGLRKLMDAGWYIEIYSGRSRTPEGIQGIKDLFEKWDPELLQEYGSQIHFPAVKPTAKWYLDDRGWKFTNWAELTPEFFEGYRAWWQHPNSDH